MLQIIVFSFNRPMQLDTLLSSLVENWVFPIFKLDVIYNDSNDAFQRGYDLLISKFSHKANMRFHRESLCQDKYGALLARPRNIAHYLRHRKDLVPKSDFRSLCISLLRGEDCRHVMFLTDDAMFIRRVNIGEDVFQWIEASPAQRQYSLRVGVGMDGQGDAVKVCGQSLFWNFQDNDGRGNWGYPFSVDAHIYSRQTVYDLFSCNIFCNPNTLEGCVNGVVRRRRMLREGMGGLYPCILSYPINMVQTVCKNENMGVDCAWLNAKYLDGYTMRYPVPEAITAFQQYPSSLFLFKDGGTEIVPL